MGIATQILDFLFGKKPDIFTEDGSVCHKLPKGTWEAWQKRYTSLPEYNWKNHKGTKAGGQTNRRI